MRELGRFFLRHTGGIPRPHLSHREQSAPLQSAVPRVLTRRMYHPPTVVMANGGTWRWGRLVLAMESKDTNQGPGRVCSRAMDKKWA